MIFRKSMHLYQKLMEQKVIPDEKLLWAQYHIQRGFSARRKLLKDHGGRYANGADIFFWFFFSTLFCSRPRFLRLTVRSKLEPWHKNSKIDWNRRGGVLVLFPPLNNWPQQTV